MNQNQAFEREPSNSSSSGYALTWSREPHWFDLVSVLRKRLRLLMIFAIVGIGGGIGISLLLPKIYESTATILPQLESRDGGLGSLLAASSAMSTAQTLGVNLPGMTATPTDIFISILKSRTMADEVVKRFNLLDRYEVKFMQDARTKLEGITRIAVTKEKVIRVTIEDRDPALAAEMANFYVENLDRLNRTMGISKASENRKFVEGRLKETVEALVQAEESLKEFQTKNKAVAIDVQSKAMMEAAATLQAQITAQEVQMQVMGTYLSKENPEISRVRSSIDELRKQLALMESGKSGKRVPGEQLHPAIVAVPSLALEYGRLMRNLKVQETLYTLLATQFEQAKLTEARDTPTVQVLDYAIPSERKSRPRTLVNGLLAGGAALLLGCLMAVSIELRQKKRQEKLPLAVAA